MLFLEILKKAIYGVLALTLISVPIANHGILDTSALSSATIGIENFSYSGKCGENLTYSFNTDTKTLTISGTGDMFGFKQYNKQPWNGYQKDIQKIVIEDGVTSIGDHAFCSLVNLTDISIPESVTSIGDISFSNVGLTEIHIPSKVNDLQRSIFGNNKTLKIIISEDSLYYTTIDDVIYSKDMSELVIYPDWKEDKSFTVPDGVTTLKDSCFFSNGYLQELILSDTVTDVGKCSISFCINLKSLKLSSGLKTIHTGNFANMKNLQVVIIPEGVTTIESMNFFGCDYQMVIQLPSTLTDISENCFYTSKNEHFTLVAPKDSYAWKYATDNNINITDSMDNVTIYEFGDINADQNIDYLDVLLMKKYLLGMDTTKNVLADANKDGKYNILDLLQIKSTAIK